MVDATPITKGGKPLFPPWTDEASVKRLCTGCGDCISACPEAILIAGRAGAPVVALNGGACTFCGDCVEACGEGVFADRGTRPWNIIADIGAACLLNQGVTCQSCTDACDDEALRFVYLPGSQGEIHLDRAACTGCGACLGVCPVNAITLAEPEPAPEPCQ